MANGMARLVSTSIDVIYGSKTYTFDKLVCNESVFISLPNTSRIKEIDVDFEEKFITVLRPQRSR